MSELRNLNRMASKGRLPWYLRAVIWVGIFLVGSAVVITAAYYFDVATESREFCGLLCHPNEPQYVAQNVSPHADVECGVCHVGPGLLPKIQAKILGTRELYALVTNTYERPIPHPVNQLRPAEVICGQCHSPDLTFEDEMVRVNHFASDQENTVEQTLLMLKTGGGGQEGGAHWHIENPVWFVSPDVDSQEILWVSTVNEEGVTVEYRATESSLSDSELAALPRQEMDCLDCHNRATHRFEDPEGRLNEAIADGTIDSELPYVKREGLELLTAGYISQEAAVEAMDGLAEFYRAEYPVIYEANKESVDRAVDTLKEIYSQTTFPRMNLTWRSYPDNLGHTDFPGCFRCHDGDHVSQEGAVIPYDCSLCHTVPATAAPGEEPPAVQLANWVRSTERPEPHDDPDFIRDHRILADQSCAECHGTIEYGTDGSRFCANEFCHEQGLPGVKLEPPEPHPFWLVGGHADVSCIDCHQGEREPAESDDCASCHQPPSPHFGQECADCHTPFGWQESAAAWSAVVSLTPHRVQPDLDCLSCHSDDGATSIPENHADFPVDLCVTCHRVEVDTDAPVIPHTIEGVSNCLVCHDRDRLKPVPLDHQGWSNDFCLLCHTPSGDE
jgi:hypothetical protein